MRPRPSPAVTSGQGAGGGTASAARPRRSSSAMAHPLPRVVALDLDATVWYPEMYMLSGPPFKHSIRKGEKQIVTDRAGEDIYLMADTQAILAELATDPQWAGTQVAYVSRTDEPVWAAKCLHLFQAAEGTSLHQLGVLQEIYPGSKRTHFKRIHERTRIPYAEILFFDNESWNISDVAPMGVVCQHTPRGMTREVWDKGLREYAKRRAAAAAS